MKPEPTRRKAVLNRTDTDNSGLIQQRTWKVRNLASPLVYDWILCFGTAILFQKPLCKYHVSHCWYGNNPTNEKCRNPWKIKASGTSWSRGWENRTPAKSFGDSCHTIWPIPYIKFCSGCKETPFQMYPCTFKTTYKSTFHPAFLSTFFGYALDLLVTVSSMCCHTSTSALSTSSSSRGFTS